MRLLEFLHKIDEEVLLEAAKDRYMQMFQNIPQEVYAASKIDDSKIGDIVANTMRALQRSDRVTWALRLTRYHILQLAKDNATKIIPVGFEPGGSMNRSINTNAKNLEETKRIETAFKVIKYVEKEQRRLSVKSNVAEHELEKSSRYVAVGTFLNRMEHFLSLPIQGIQDYQFVWQTAEDLERDMINLEDEWKATRRSQLSHTEDYDEDEINKIISFKDGSAWFDLQRNACRLEGDAMGHCGNTADTLSDHTVLSYRTPVPGEDNRWIPHMTFILNKSNGTLGEMKGRANEKPVEKYHPYIVELLKQPYIKGFGPGGYQPENNFNIDDLPEEQANALKEMKPGFMSPIEQYKKEGMTGELAERVIGLMDAASGENTKWHEEEKEFTIDTYKNLTQAVEFVGGDTAKWVAGVMDGSNDNYQDHESYVEDSQIAEIMDSLDPELQRKIGAYAEAKYGEEYGEDDEIDFTNNDDIISVFNDWDSDFIDGGKRAVGRGMETGAEIEMSNDFSKWLEDLSENFSIRVKHEWDEGAELRITEEGMMDLVSDDDTLYDIEHEGLTKTLVPKDLEQPYNGWYGYDEDSAKEQFIEELDDEIYNFEIKDEEVEA